MRRTVGPVHPPHEVPYNQQLGAASAPIRHSRISPRQPTTTCMSAARVSGLTPMRLRQVAPRGQARSPSSTGTSVHPFTPQQPRHSVAPRHEWGHEPPGHSGPTPATITGPREAADPACQHRRPRPPNTLGDWTASALAPQSTPATSAAHDSRQSPQSSSFRSNAATMALEIRSPHVRGCDCPLKDVLERSSSQLTNGNQPGTVAPTS